MEVYTGSSDQDHPQEKEMQKAKQLSEEALQAAEKRGEAKGKGTKGKIDPSECRVPKKSKKRKESLLQQSMQRNRGKEQNGKDKRSLQDK